MAITITTISIRDNLGQLHVVLNSNFSALKDGIESIESKINPATGNLSVSNATFQKGARSTATEIVINEASERIKGDLSIEGTTSLQNVSVSNASTVTVNSGTLNLIGDASNMLIEGTSTFDGNVILKNYGASALDASEVDTYVSVSSNIGTLDISGKHAIILDFTYYNCL